MRINLHTRYTLIIVSFTVSVALILSTILILKFRSASDHLVQINEKSISQQLIKSVKVQGINLTNRLTNSLTGPLKTNNQHTIQQLIELAIAHKSVADITVYDEQGQATHNIAKASLSPENLTKLPIQDLQKLAAGKSIIHSSNSSYQLLKPIVSAKKPVGSIRVTFSLRSINQDIAEIQAKAEQQQKENLQAYFRSTLFLTILLAVLALIMSIWIARGLNRPIKQLADFAKRIGRGEFDSKISIHRDDEIGDLANSLQDMAGNLSERTEEIHFLAYHDSLTELPNRRLFKEILDNAIAYAKRHESAFAVLFIDLDDFKSINDSMGHDVGDFVIKSIAKRINDSIRGSDYVTQPGLEGHDKLLARLGGDEFIILVNDINDSIDAAAAAKRVIESVGQPFKLYNRELSIGSSIGIASYPTNGTDADSLLKNADIAMYSAKAAGKNDYRFFSAALDEAVHRKLTLLDELDVALKENQLQLWYQPLYRIADSQLVGAEALIRWKHPDKGFISPAEFIPVAEERDHIHQIGGWVLEQACQKLKQWNSTINPSIHISINVSAAQLQREALLETLSAELKALGSSASNLHIEITETYLLKDEKVSKNTLDKIKALGVKIWLDDFGTGYSALSHLKRFSVDGVKIDQSFVSGLEINEEDKELTRAIIAMADAMQLEVIAEGVETDAQWQILTQYGCHYAQGFLLARPMPAMELEALLKRQQNVGGGHK